MTMRYLPLILFCALSCLGADKYVATTGSDTTGTGAIGAPWRTIRKGIDTMAAGDTLYLRGGTYEESVIPSTAIKSGTSEPARTRLVGYTGETAIFRPTNNIANGHGIYCVNQSNLWFQGFTICMTNAPGVTNNANSALMLQGVANVTVTNMLLVNIPRQDGITLFSSTAQRHRDCVIIDNTITNWGYDMWFRSDGTPDYKPWAIYVRRGDNTTIQGNVCIGAETGYDDPDFPRRVSGGIQFYEGSNQVCRLNRISVPGTIMTAAGTNFVVENNIGIARWGAASGLYLDGLYQDSSGRIDNNTLWLDKTQEADFTLYRGLTFTVGEYAVVARNNILVGWDVGVRAAGSGHTGTILLTNNIITTVGPWVTGGILSDYGTITTDPLFTDTSDFPDGFKWPLNSPARNAGVDLSSLFAVDYYGTVRPQEGFFDIGFYEWSTGGQLPTVSVAADGTGYAHELGLVPQTFTFTRTESTSGNLTVNFTISGTAVAGTHYTAFSDSVVIPDGNATATATVTPLAVAGYQGDKTVIVTLDADAAYTLKSPSAATITIAEADPPPQRILRTQPSPGQTSRRGPKL